MAVSVDWPSGVITVYQADMVDLGGGVYQLDVGQLYLDLKSLEGRPHEGMAWFDAHQHNPPYVISGITFAQSFEIINGYTLTISPAGAYQVSCIGANHNVQDVYNNLTGPTLLPNLSAGLIVQETAVSGLTPTESAQLTLAADTLPGIEASLVVLEASVIAVENDVATIQTDIGFIQVDQALATKILRNKKITYKSGPDVGKMVIYDDDGTTVLLVAQIWEDDTGSIPYQGSGLERQERLDTP